MQAKLGQYEERVGSAVAQLAQAGLVERIWDHDYTAWRDDPTEISNRLGWLHVAGVMARQVERLTEFVDSVRAAGYTQALLLGMGGSSLAPEVFRDTFQPGAGYLDLRVLDSTVPGAVLEAERWLDPEHALVIVSTKSGGTVETFSFFKRLYSVIAGRLGAEHAGEHFMVITDPGSSLVKVAEQYRFRAAWLNDSTIGGRFSALSFFGLLPAALLGVDLPLLLGRGQQAAVDCRRPGADNLALRLGVAMAELAAAGRDKLTLLISPQLASFGNWVEQLVAESTGKEGKGILPVVGEPLGVPELYGQDRLFVHLRLEGDTTYDEAAERLAALGHPVVTLPLADAYDLGAQFFLWEMATAIAGARLDINPFDQPNVEAAKVLARRLVAEYLKAGSLPAEQPALSESGVTLYGPAAGYDLAKAVADFIAGTPVGGYVAVHAYLRPDRHTDAALLAFRRRVRDELGLAATAGYGPRFLHSTGQLHKGDAGLGRFIQVTADDPADVPIPNEADSPAADMTFGVLKMAQALGDAQALRAAGRQVLRVHLSAEAPGLPELVDELPRLQAQR